MSGRDGVDRLFGGSGNYQLFGGAGADFITGGAGNDYIVFFEGDTIDGGAGLDQVTFINRSAASGFYADFTTYFAGGDAILLAGSIKNVELISLSEAGSQFDDRIILGSSYTYSVSVDGWQGDDYLVGGETTDFITGGDGDDQLYGLEGGDRLVGGSGNDIVEGGTGDDEIEDGPGNDVVSGGDGNDRVILDDGVDQISGGAGIDLLVVNGSWNANGVITIDLATGVIRSATSGDDVISEIENILIGNGVFIVIGDDGANEFSSYNMAELRGGNGDDVYRFLSVTPTVIEEAGGGIDKVFANGNYTLPDHVENLAMEQGARATLIRGNALDNVIDTGPGVDRVEGLGGDDTLTGGFYTDVLDGGAGNDTVSYAFQGSFGDSIKVSLGNAEPQPTGSAGTDTLIDIENLIGSEGDDYLWRNGVANRLTGRSGDDNLDGRDGDDVLDGSAGDDFLIGGYGADQMIGGAGDDLFLVEEVADSVVELAGEGFDQIATDVSYTLAAGLSVEILAAVNGSSAPSAAQPLNLTGNELAQDIYGNDNRNILRGEGGDDVLFGGLDSDTLTGGDGTDTFWARLADVAGDVLTDFGLGERLWLLDAALDEFRFRRVGDTLTLPGGPTGVSVFLPGGANPSLIVRAAEGGGVELVAAGHEAHANDFNADGHGDLLWRHAPSGAFTTWNGSGNILANGFVENSYFSVAQPVTTQAVASLDWNGDGRSDMLWRDAAGTFGVWAGSANGFTPDATTIAGIGRDWSVTAVGDFSGDGRDDLMFRNDNGALTVWASSGAGFTPNVFASFADPTWVVAGVMDFDGDGRDDIVWRNATAGHFSIWTANGTDGATSFRPNAYYDTSVDGAWSIVGLADFNGDGLDDLLWRNANGIFTEWQSTGSGFRANVYADASVSPVWSVAQVADMNGDGMADIVWRNADVGHLSVWQSTGDGFIPNTAYVASVSTDWALIGAGGMVPLV